MALSAARWKTITESRFDWERNALEFLRERLPDIEPYRAWSNFDFIAEDGSINEVDDQPTMRASCGLRARDGRARYVRLSRAASVNLMLLRRRSANGSNLKTS